MSVKEGKLNITTWLDKNAKIFTSAADRIWGLAETRFDVAKSEDVLAALLADAGFTIKKNVAEIPGAFVASWGQGGPTIGFLAEYDALSNLSQVADATEKKAEREDGAGHGCGHNLLGVGATAAAIAIKNELASAGGVATIKLFGCPAEESGSGKAFMARAGVFDGTDAIFTWHPWAETRVWGSSSLANYQVFFNFKGISAHAAAAPEAGRSALDAAELMNVGVNYLREHVIQEARIHYAYTNVGGASPNVVQPNATVLYFIRAPRSSQVKPIFERVVDVAKGAALMTGTSMQIEWDSACSEFIVNDTLSRALYENMRELGDIKYTDKEEEYASEFVRTLPETAKKSVESAISRAFSGVSKSEAEKMADMPIQGELYPYELSDAAMSGSTDVGDASWIAPTAQVLATCYPTGTLSHSWQWVATGKSSIAHKGMLYAAKAMAMTALDVIHDPETLKKAKDEHVKRRDGEEYHCAIPADVKPR